MTEYISPPILPNKARNETISKVKIVNLAKAIHKILIKYSKMKLQQQLFMQGLS